MDEADRRFAGNLRFYRERGGMTQADLAARMADGGFAFRQQTIARIESLARRVSLGEAIALGRAVGTTADALSRPHGLAHDAWQVMDAARSARAAHTAVREQARKFGAEQDRLRRAIGHVEKEGHAVELADELAVGRRAAELSLDAAIAGRRA